ncbi:MAG: hypothetical protein ABJH68_01045 [Ilumatobacter sp.]|uniref:hypothetical protein n=1 Tax=Ilumatobacter sp. TaxID=1967498 RepID=UPI003297F539
MTSSGPQSWWKAVLTYPPTWVAGALLAVLAAGFVVAVDPPPVMIGAMGVVVVLAVVGWPLVMSMTGTLSGRQFAVPEVESDDRMATATLATELSGISDSQPLEQLIALGQKRAALIKVLDRRLDRTELTYSRYVSTSEQVYRSALDNLREVAVAIDSVGSIDTGYIKRRLAELDRSGAQTESAVRERESLAQRTQLRDDQMARIERLLAQNEVALTTLDRTTSALADVPVGQRPEDVDAAMAALADLADRARLLDAEEGP